MPTLWVSLGLVLLAADASVQFSVAVSQDAGEGSPIAGVITLLKDMAEKSKQDGTEEAKTFKAFKCYCDKTTEEKKTSVSDLSTSVASLEHRIEELTATKVLAEIQTMKGPNRRGVGLGQEAVQVVCEYNSVKLIDPGGKARADY
ncbi:unnamed protein product [Polarella glacialis]|uniref:Uncharacterized protein n=1 Tax=Polarella glacialis TaxID=89957 RepID=A0A813HCS7_POLGL|nr:unnamed protein product [Polarella glacialis]